MCDSRNTTHIVETECWLCPDRASCSQFDESYINRCDWFVIPGRTDESGRSDGICIDGLDYLQIGMCGPVGVLGWGLLTFAIGWVRKDRGKFANLRRYGLRVTATVVGRFIDNVFIPTAEGLPELPVARYWAWVRWKPRPPPQSTWWGFLLRPRWGPCKAAGRRVHTRWCCCLSWRCCGGGGGGGGGGACFGGRGRGGKGGGLKPWQRLMDAQGVVKVRVQLPKVEWDRARLTNGLLGTLRIVYDPWDDMNWVLPEAALGHSINRCATYSIALFMGCSLIAMSTKMIIDGFHCGPHFWGFHSCCSECDDWGEIGTLEAGTLEQRCYRGGCDGLSGKAHVYWCNNDSMSRYECYIGWAMLPLPTAFAGITLAIITLLQKNYGICRVGSKCDRFTGLLCGEGKFCCPDGPPRMYKRDAEMPNARALLDFANASGHL
jgi:hypothetical protein